MSRDYELGDVPWVLWQVTVAAWSSMKMRCCFWILDLSYIKNKELSGKEFDTPVPPQTKKRLFANLTGNRLAQAEKRTAPRRQTCECEPAIGSNPGHLGETPPA
jgi:hypothetical protein